jgi:hypothetical protein
MPPLLCPSPIILDQSFPRSEDVLKLVASALGNLQDYLQNGRANLVLSDVLQLFVAEFDWERTGPYPLLIDLYNLLVQWCLQPHDGLLTVNLDTVPEAGEHPVPADCKDNDLVQLWAIELNKLLRIHDTCAAPGDRFIGVACHRAFGGELLGNYGGDPVAPFFPLVGPDLYQLSDAFDWLTPADLHQKQVTFEAAKANISLLGAEPIKTPRRGSHFKVKFPGAPRSWVLDPNVNPLSDDFVRELVPLTNLPFAVIKTVLLTGTFPEKVLKLKRTNMIAQECIRFGR